MCKPFYAAYRDGSFKEVKYYLACYLKFRYLGNFPVIHSMVTPLYPNLQNL